MHHELPLYRADPVAGRAREVTAALLRAAGATLDRLAHRLACVPSAVAAPEPLVEFHAEAGAPEGALYVDGQLVGRVEGVSRL